MRQRPTLKTILLCLGVFFVFLIARFPYRNLQGYVYGQIYKWTAVRIESEDLSPTFLGWPGVTLYRANMSLPVGQQWQLDLVAEQVTARVGIGGLFPPAPLLSLYFHGFQKGGNLYLRGTRSSSFIGGSMQAERLGLSQFLKLGLPEPIEGTLNGSGDFGYNLVDLSRSSGAFDLSFTNLKIPAMNLQGIVLPSVSWDEVRAKLAVQNGSLEITQCHFGTPKSDIRGTLTGSIRLGRDFPSSFVNLTMRIQISEAKQKDPQSATLVSFLKTFKSEASGDYGLKWNARISDMSTNIMMALPQKAD